MTTIKTHHLVRITCDHRYLLQRDGDLYVFYDFMKGRYVTGADEAPGSGRVRIGTIGQVKRQLKSIGVKA